jgi:methyl-accepting chemotaxis protein
MFSTEFLKAISVRLELITYVVVVPFVCIFIIFVNGFNLLESMYFMIGALVASSVTLLIVPTIRWIHLKNILIPLKRPVQDRNQEEMSNLKTRLLNFPLVECIYVNFQWGAGVPLAAVVSSYFLNYGFQQYFSYFIALVMISFINVVTHFFTCEILIGNELSHEQWEDIAAPNIKIISLRRRILFSVLSVVWLCFFMFGYLVIIENQKIIHLENIFIFIPILGIQLLVVVGLVTYLFSYSTTKNSRDLIKNLIYLAEGKIGAKAPMISSDEIGVIKNSLNHFNIRLRKIVTDIGKESDRLLQFSKTLNSRSRETTGRLIEQATSTEQMSDASKSLMESASQILHKTDDQMKQMIRSNESLKSLNTRISEIELTSKEAGIQSETMESLAQMGSDKIQISIGHMNDIRDITLKIQGISSLVSEIADRVGLLSLNASIEAARAGEAGRGFAVVAQEISKLGESTQKSSKEIDGLVNQAVKVVNFGTNSMQDLNQAMSTILTSVEEAITNIKRIQNISKDQAEISQVVAENSEALFAFTKDIVKENKDQALILNQISDSVKKVAENTNYLVSAAGENQNVADDLQDQSTKLNKTLSFFKLHTKDSPEI